jgi:hypothetical protein
MFALGVRSQTYKTRVREVVKYDKCGKAYVLTNILHKRWNVQMTTYYSLRPQVIGTRLTLEAKLLAGARDLFSVHGGACDLYTVHDWLIDLFQNLANYRCRYVKDLHLGN